MAETSPYAQEEEIENSIEEELLALLLVAFIKSSGSFQGGFFSFNQVDTANSQFVKELSKITPTLNAKGSEAITVGLDRAMRETDLKDLTYNFSSQRFRDAISDIFDKHVDFLTATNERMVQRLLELATERGWGDQEIIRRLKLYWGLTPDHMVSVVKLEDALRKENATNAVIRNTVQKKIDNLIEWRASLTTAQIATEVTENSKAVAFAEMFEEGDVSGDYVKEWRAVLDENTTQICTSSHLSIAELNGNFPNGLFSPPAFPPVHPCRSTIRIIKRPQQ